MRLLYVAVAIGSALLGMMVLEAKPTTASGSPKAARPVLQSREVVAKTPATAPAQSQDCCSDESCCSAKPGGSAKSCCKGK